MPFDPNSIPPGQLSDADGDVSSIADLSDPEENDGSADELLSVNGVVLSPSGPTPIPTLGQTGIAPLEFIETTLAVITSLQAAAELAEAATAGPLAPLVAAKAAMDFASEADRLLTVYRESAAFNEDNGPPPAGMAPPPFDPNFAQPYTPVVPLVTPLSSSPAIPAPLLTDAQTLLQNEAQVASDADAAFITQNRLVSATQMRDSTSVNLQETALIKFVSMLGAAHLAVGQDATALSKVLTADNLDDTPSITSQDITSLQNNIKANGFSALPTQEQIILNGFGLTPADKTAIANQIVSVDPASVLSASSTTGNNLQQLATDSTNLGNLYSGKSTPTPSPTSMIPPPATPANFDVSDQTTGQTGTSAGAAYSGPVAGLTSEIIIATTDNINITSKVPNVFIKSGSGGDALNVATANGNNILDGSTGSNFMVGGTGNDTVFVDDRFASSDIWSTFSGFHSGDAATVFGVTQAGFDLSWVDGQGAAGFTGLTLHATAAGKPIASLTLAGFTTVDLLNGKLGISFGNEPDGTPFMFVHGN